MRPGFLLLFILFVPALSYGQLDNSLWRGNYDSAQYYWASNTKRSIDLLQRAERIAFNDLGIYDQNYLTIINDLGLAYGQVNNYGKAEEYLTRNLSIQHELNPSETAQTLLAACNLATIVLKAGDDVRAKQLYKYVLAEAATLEVGEVHITAAENLANLYEVQQYYDSALATVKNALAVHFADPSLETEYQFHLMEARILRKMKNYTASGHALMILSKSLQSTTLGVNSIGYAVRMEQSLTLLETGSYGKAELDLLALYRELKSLQKVDETLITEVTNALAYTYDKLSIYDKALIYYQESFKSCLKNYGYNSLSCAVVQNNIAGILLKQGKASQAIGQYEEFLQTYRALSKEHSTVYLTTLNNLGTAYRQTQQYGKAKEQYALALTLLTTNTYTDSDLQATVLNNLAVTQMLQGEYNMAQPNFEKAIQLQQDIYGEDSPVLLNSLENLAVTYWAAGNYSEAMKLFSRSLAMTAREIRYIFPNLTEREQIQFYQRKKLAFERFNTLAIQHATEYPQLVAQMFNHQLLLKSISFLTNKSRNARLRGNETLKPTLERVETARVELGHAYQLSRLEQTNLKTSVSHLEQQIDSLEKVIRHQLADDDQVTIQPLWKDVQQSLKPNEALVDIIRFRKYDVFNKPSELLSQQITAGFTDSVYYAALVTTSETTDFPKLVVLKDGARLEKRYHRFYYNTIAANMEDTISYGQYWYPIERELTNKKTIYLTLDGIYHQLNLNVIRDRSNRFILEKYDLQTLLNPVQLLNRSNPLPLDFSKTVLFGDPAFSSNGLNNDFEALPGSREEISEIVKSLKLSASHASIYLQHTATETNLRKVKSPSILHVATHGFFSADMITQHEDIKDAHLFHSGLVLASGNSTNKDFDRDGIVTAYELMNLDLNGTQLVVLSACETGLGKVEVSEGVFGLQRSFLQAGASHVILSLWKVEDMTTKALMSKFYSYLGQRYPLKEAFKRAQLDMLKSSDNRNDWGAFVLVQGD